MRSIDVPAAASEGQLALNEWAELQVVDWHNMDHFDMPEGSEKKYRAC